MYIYIKYISARAVSTMTGLRLVLAYLVVCCTITVSYGDTNTLARELKRILAKLKAETE